MRPQAFDITKRPRRVCGAPATDSIRERRRAKRRGEAAYTEQHIGPAVKTGSRRTELPQLIVLA